MVSMNPARKRPLRAHPLTQSLQPLATMTAVLTAFGMSFALFVPGLGLAGVDWSRVADLGRGVLLDAGWLLPALLSANLGLVAIVFAQTVTNADAQLLATTRRVATGGSVFIAGCAGSVALLSSTALTPATEAASHLFAIVVLATVIIGISLWMSLLFFGTPAAQLGVALELSRVARAADGRLGPTGPLPARGVFGANVSVIAGFATLFYFVSSAGLDQPVPNNSGAVIVLVLLTMGATALIYFAELGFAEWSSQLGRNAARAVLALGLFGPVVLLASDLVLGGLSAAGLAVMAAVTLPLLSAWMPLPSPVRGWSLRIAVNTRTRARLLKRIDQLQAFIDDLQRRKTQLILR